MDVSTSITSVCPTEQKVDESVFLPSTNIDRQIKSEIDLETEATTIAVEQKLDDDTMDDHRIVLLTNFASRTSYECNLCQKSFNRKVDSIHHLRICVSNCYLRCLKKLFNIHIKKQILLKCTFCEKEFKQMSSLKIHLHKHLDGEPFKCKFCHMSFKQKSSLIEHFKVHLITKDLCNNEWKFTCNICEKAFKNIKKLKIHLNKHRGNYKIDICEEF